MVRGRTIRDGKVHGLGCSCLVLSRRAVASRVNVSLAKAEIHQPLDIRDDLGLVVHGIRHDTTDEVSCLLSVSVDITLTLLEV